MNYLGRPEALAFFGHRLVCDDARNKRMGTPPQGWHEAKLASGGSTHPYFDDVKVRAANVAVSLGYVFA